MATASGTTSDPAMARSIASAQGMVGKVGHVARKAFVAREDLPPCARRGAAAEIQDGEQGKELRIEGGHTALPGNVIRLLRPAVGSSVLSS